MHRLMWTSTIVIAVIIIAAVYLVVSTVPMKNEINGKTLTTHFILGKTSLDLSDAVFKPVPEDACSKIIKVYGTSIGNKMFGRFKNYKTKSKYYFILTGIGEKTYFEIGDKKYLIDGIKIYSQP